MNEFTQRLEDLKDKMDKFIDKLCYSYMWHVRIVVDKISGDKEYDWSGSGDNIEISNIKWHNHPGWGKPDKQFGDVEIRYLWKQFHPKI